MQLELQVKGKEEQLLLDNILSLESDSLMYKEDNSADSITRMLTFEE